MYQNHVFSFIPVINGLPCGRSSHCNSISPRRAVVQSQYEEVSRLSFPDVLEKIRSIGKEAAFFSLDTEFTGYRQEERDEYFDTVQERYLKKKRVAERYLLVQMGLSAFVWDKALEDYKAFTWNIHLYPSKLQSERIFSCDASSLSFLRSHNLDFNLWVDGVPFLAIDQEASLRKQVEDQAEWDLKANAYAGKKPARSNFDPNADAETVELHRQLKEALDKLGPGAEPFLLPQNLSWFRKKMVQNTIGRHPRKANLWLEVIDPPAAEAGAGVGPTSTSLSAYNLEQLQVRYVDTEERIKCVQAKKSQALTDIEEAAGAMRILKVIKDSGRPLVGHNFFLDLLFLYTHFVKPTLPDTAMGFKAKVQHFFPSIYDTKVLAKSLGVTDEHGDTNLAGLYRKEGGGRVALEGVTGAAHEAGHDAFMTGVIFSSLLRRIKAKLSENISDCGTSPSPLSSPCSMPSLAYAENWSNKVFMRLTDVESFELRNFKQIPDRTRVFHVRTRCSGALPHLQHHQLRRAFSSLGSVQIKALGKHEAYVVFHDITRPPPEVSELKELVSSSGAEADEGLEIVTYEERRVALGILW